jgi:hypothetical protein
MVLVMNELPMNDTMKVPITICSGSSMCTHAQTAGKLDEVSMVCW